ncbi:MAG: glycosyltransferase family 2 protein [Acidimicrobiales bacterium]
MALSGTRVTVVIPVWDGYVRLLTEAVSSVRAQSVWARIIVVDNASCSPVPAPAGCELVRAEERLSTGAARNLGLALVTSAYVMFLDADDRLLRGALCRLVRGLDRHPDSPALVAQIFEPTGALHRRPLWLARSLAKWQRAFAWLNAVWPLVSIQGQGCMVLRTDAARRAGGYGDASSGEDWLLAAALAFDGPFAFDAAPVLLHRMHQAGTAAEETTIQELRVNASLVRDRLREVTAAGSFALAIVSIAHLVVLWLVRPLVRGVRRCALAGSVPRGRLRGRPAS